MKDGVNTKERGQPQREWISMKDGVNPKESGFQ